MRRSVRAVRRGLWPRPREAVGDRVLARYGLAGPSPRGRVVHRSERPGDLAHLDVKKLGKIPDGGGWRKMGRPEGRHHSPDTLGFG
jgi:hypothetical protein